MQTTSGLNAASEDLLKKLADSEGPCITIMLPTSAEADLRPQVKNAVRDIRRELENFGPELDALLEPVAAFSNEGVPPSQREAGTWVALRSPSLFETFVTPLPLPPLVDAGKNFPVIKLVPILSDAHEFYLLALSQKRVRLLYCTTRSSEPVELPAGTPLSLSDAMQTRKPDHTLDNKATAGPSTGSMRGVLFGTTTDRDSKDEYLHHYFQEIDRAINSLLKGSGKPLIVAAVDHELALYKRLNTWPDLVEPGVSGAPDGLKGGEMHRRALALLQSRLAPPVRKALDEFDKSVGTGHASVHAREIVEAAHEGRVQHLFLQDSAEYKGYFQGKERDLLNDAAIDVIRQGGTVSVLKSGDMPNGVPVCALFRYPAPVHAARGTG